MRVLAGDIGGTKTLLTLMDLIGSDYEELKRERFVSADYSGLEAMIAEFLGGARTGLPIEAACFGVAGPIVGERIELPNLPWAIDVPALKAALKVDNTALINDFAAIGYGLDLLRDEDLLCLQEGSAESRGPIAVIGAGTGLGQASLYWEGEGYRVHASEGGHCSFAPQNASQYALHAYVQDRLGGHVSWERLVSGNGLVSIYGFLRAQRKAMQPAELGRAMAEGDAAAAISLHAIEGLDPICVEALDLFASLYGAEAGNLALKVLATGGVYVAGGIAPRIAAWLQRGPFVTAFRAKGRMASVLEKMPVRVVLNPQVGLLGAAACAARLARSGSGAAGP